MIVVMSGNFLQRGEPAIVDKWTRTKMALQGGADIVIELPVAFSVQPADYFAKGAVTLLNEMKCEAISFGSESGKAKDFLDAAHMYWVKKEEIDAAFQRQEYGDTYPRQIQQAIESVLTDSALDLSKPNNTLGFAYAKANVQLDRPLEMYIVPRKSGHHREKGLGENGFSSATAIRRTLLSLTDNEHDGLEKTRPFVPAFTMNELKERPYYSWENLWPFLSYQLAVQDTEKLKEIYQMTEGIEYRFKEKGSRSGTMMQFLESVKTKRNTWTKIQRLSVYTLLQFTEKEMQVALENGPEAIRLLGFNAKGREYLRQNKKEISLPILSKISRENKKMWQMDCKAGEVYRMMDPQQISHQDFYTIPIQFI